MKPKFIESFIQKTGTINFSFMGITLLAICFSFLSWLISYQRGYTTAYNDAMSHLNLSRMIFDNLHPGFSQIGGVWLPLNHLLFLPLIWNDWAWHSGFAGSIISMLSYTISVLLIYRITHYLLKQKFPALIAATTFAINPNILYLQSTPLTEPLFLLIFICSFYFFVKWIIERKYMHFISFALTGFFLVLTRYDGWFIILLQLVLLGINEVYFHKKTLREMLGVILIAAIPAFYGIGLWLLWNKLIFGSALFFALGPYSAHAQQVTLSHTSGLITHGNMWMSVLTYFYSVIDNVGIVTFLIALFCATYFMIQEKSIHGINKALIILFLLGPVLFNILSLFFGFSVLNVPELHWNPTHNPSSQWFNVRYGILALPMIATSIGLALKNNKIVGILLLGLIMFQSIIMIPNNIITLQDGIKGSSSFLNDDIANYLKSNVSQQDKVLLSTSYFNPVVFKSNIAFKQIIHEGVNTLWNESLNYPQKGPRWIVMANGTVGDPVYNTLVNLQKNNFLVYYKLAYSGAHALVYEKKSLNDYFIKRNKDKLLLGTNEFTITGVNSYDLSYKSDIEIRKDFDYFTKMHITTIRIWAFGDGNADGFQPKAGVTNEKRLVSLDLILQLAKENNIRVIPVLVNNWTDYGGKSQYVKWNGKNTSDDFYINPAIKNLFKNYVNKIITRKNTYTGVAYKDDSTILAWDIMNEPRTNDNAYNNEILQSWVTDISTYIKTVDNNHLVMVGTENIIDQSSTNVLPLCAIKTIDICSVHFYLDDKTQSQYPTVQSSLDYLKSQQIAAHDLQKPVLIGEIGISKKYHSLSLDPIALFKTIIPAISTQKYTGFLIWNWSLQSDESYGFSPSGNQSNEYSLKDLMDIEAK